ncbi:MAG: ParA family protein [Euryarchaeota archaeon]|nr:ParA family protein [Euryarchaeota archaeon]
MTKARTYVGVSPRGGVGATYSLMNLANNVSEDLKTLYIDLDPINPGGTSLLKLENRNNVLDVAGKKTIDNAFIYDVENFEVMPLYLYKSRDMSSYLEKEDETVLFLINKIHELEKSYDVIFVDTPPGYMRTSIKVWQRFDNLIGFGNYDIQSLSSLLQVMDIFKEWAARNLVKRFSCFVFTDIGTHKKIDESVLWELYMNTPIYTLPYTKEFFSSSPFAVKDTLYLSAVRGILKNLNIKPR